MAYTCKTSSAKNIVGVLPYLPYSKVFIKTKSTSENIKFLVVAKQNEEERVYRFKIAGQDDVQSRIDSSHYR